MQPAKQSCIAMTRFPHTNNRCTLGAKIKKKIGSP